MKILLFRHKNKRQFISVKQIAFLDFSGRPPLFQHANLKPSAAPPAAAGIRTDRSCLFSPPDVCPFLVVSCPNRQTGCRYELHALLLAGSPLMNTFPGFGTAQQADTNVAPDIELVSF